jgi:hypothetical protein
MRHGDAKVAARPGFLGGTVEVKGDRVLGQVVWATAKLSVQQHGERDDFGIQFRQPKRREEPEPKETEEAAKRYTNYNRAKSQAEYPRESKKSLRKDAPSKGVLDRTKAMAT